jgi:hypothetical protein
MVTYFNKKDLIKFGEFLLSEQRTNRIKESYSEKDNISLEERLTTVYQLDIDIFLDILKNKD